MANQLIKPQEFFQKMADELNELSIKHNIPTVDILNCLANHLGSPVAFVQKQPTLPTMTKDEIENVLGPMFRQMMLDQQDTHLPKIGRAVQQLSLHLTEEPVIIFAGNSLSARAFANKICKKHRVICNPDQLRGLRLAELVILEGTLKGAQALNARHAAIAYARDAKIWHIYEW